jgi:hypothetical protein
LTFDKLLVCTSLNDPNVVVSEDGRTGNPEPDPDLDNPSVPIGALVELAAGFLRLIDTPSSSSSSSSSLTSESFCSSFFFSGLSFSPSAPMLQALGEPSNRSSPSSCSRREDASKSLISDPRPDVAVVAVESDRATLQAREPEPEPEEAADRDGASL